MISAYQSSAIKTAKGFKNLFHPDKLTREGDYLTGVLELYTPEGVSDDFKYYIPPGTVKFKLFVVPSCCDVYALLRLGAPCGERPELVYDVYADKAFNNKLPGYSLAQVKAADRASECDNDIIYLVSHDSIYFNSGEADYEQIIVGDWLYVTWQGNAKQITHRLEFTVNAYTYTDWYENEATWDSDGDVGVGLVHRAVDTYVDLTGHYGRATASDTTGLCFFNVGTFKWNEKERMFIPPGTAAIDYNYIEQPGSSLVLNVRFNEVVGSSPTGGGGTNYTLDDITGSDGETKAGTEGYVYAVKDGFPNYLTTDGAGWLYAWSEGSMYTGDPTSHASSSHTTNFILRIHAETYNAWYDKYIGSEDRWDQYITNVETFVNPSAISGNTVAPAGCVSLTGHYGKAVDSENGIYNFTNTDESLLRLDTFSRVFIPPGASSIAFYYVTDGDNACAVARHKQLMTSQPNSSTTEQKHTLEELIGGDCYSKVNGYDQLFIIGESISSPFLGVDKAGWLYIKYADDGTRSMVTQHFSVGVDVTTYNAWYDKYIGSEDRWNTYITNVEKFVNPSAIGTTDENPITIEPTELDFGSCYAGETVEKSIKVTNNGSSTESVNFDTKIMFPPLMLKDRTQRSLSVPAGESVTVVIKFTPPDTTYNSYSISVRAGYLDISIKGICLGAAKDKFQDVYSINNTSVKTLCEHTLNNNALPYQFTYTLNNDILQYRIFIFAGTKYNYVGFLSWSNNSVIHFSMSFMGVPDEVKTNSTSTKYTLSDCLNKTVYGYRDSKSPVNLLEDNNYIEIDKTGWLYIRFKVISGSLPEMVVSYTAPFISKDMVPFPSTTVWYKNSLIYDKAVLPIWDSSGNPIENSDAVRNISVDLLCLPNAIDFGEVGSDTETSQTSRLVNCGKTAFNLQNIQAGNFYTKIVAALPTFTAMDIPVYFKTTSTTLIEKYIPIKDNTGRYCYIYAKGKAKTGSTENPTDYSITPSTYNYGYIAKGSTSEKKEFTFKNNTTNAVYIMCRYPTGFTGSSSTVSVASKKSTNIGVYFKPTSEQSYSGTLEILQSTTGGNDKLISQELLAYNETVDDGYFSIHQASYWLDQTRKGFKAIYDPKKITSVQPQSDGTYTMTVQSKYGKVPSTGKAVTSDSDLVTGQRLQKIFVPPGKYTLNCWIESGNTALNIFCIVSVDAPPKMDAMQYSYDTLYTAYLEHNQTLFPSEFYTKQNCFTNIDLSILKERGMSCFVLPRNAHLFSIENSTIETTTGCWVYLNMNLGNVNETNALWYYELTKHSSSPDILKEYSFWYDNAVWDNYGDPVITTQEYEFYTHLPVLTSRKRKDKYGNEIKNTGGYKTILSPGKFTNQNILLVYTQYSHYALDRAGVYFRIYVPKGCTKFNLTVTDRKAQVTGRVPSGYIGLAWNKDPQLINYTSSNTTTTGWDIADIQEGTKFIHKDENGACVLTLDSTFESLEKGGWLCVRGASYDYVMLGFEVNISVDMDTYTDWYNTATWDATDEPKITSFMDTVLVAKTDTPFLTRNASTFTIDVVSSFGWKVKTCPSWIQITSGTEGKGNATISCSCSENTWDEVRSSDIVLVDASGKKETVVSFTQTLSALSKETYLSLHQLAHKGNQIGFRNAFDLDVIRIADNIILEGEDIGYKMGTGELFYPDQYKAYQVTTHKIFIPGGTHSFTWMCYCPQNADAYAIVRAGKPPEINDQNLYSVFEGQDTKYFPTEAYPQWPVGIGNPTEQTMLEKYDCFVQNNGGHIYFLHDNVFTSDKGMWVYVNIYLAGSPSQSTYYTWQWQSADISGYETWFTWMDSIKGMWASDGDPASAGATSTTETILATTSLQGTAISGGTTEPEEENDFLKLADEYAKQYVQSKMSEASSSEKYDKYEKQFKLVDSVPSDYETNGNLVLKFNKLKVAGEYGSYGLKNLMQDAKKLKAGSANSASFYMMAAQMYSALGNKIDPGEFKDPPPGYDSTETLIESDTLREDLDHPTNITKLKKEADYTFKYRKRDSKYIWPTGNNVDNLTKINKTFGMFQVENSVVYVSTYANEPGEPFAVGLQEPKRNVKGCKGVSGNRDYRLKHVNCDEDATLSVDSSGTVTFPDADSQDALDGASSTGTFTKYKWGTAWDTVAKAMYGEADVTDDEDRLGIGKLKEADDTAATKSELEAVRAGLAKTIAEYHPA